LNGIRNAFLYVGIILIWGSTWLAIKFQLGRVDPLVSVFYRFLSAAAISLVLCRALGLGMRFKPREHAWIALQGLLLFSVGYWLVYTAELSIASGLAAVITSSLIFMNIMHGRLFLKKPVRGHVVSGALLGITGIVLIFLPEFSSLHWSDGTFKGFVSCTVSTVIYSMGNIVSERNQKAGMPVLQTNTLGMGYASLVLLALILAEGKRFDFEASPLYIGSLLYLSVFGSVVAFWCYMTLIGRIGADKAAYGPLVVPVMALGLSTLFEDYRWTCWAAAGILFIVFGNLTVLKNPLKTSVKRGWMRLSRGEKKREQEGKKER
jgi:drug/metabolite transporter (DMT)-like permease